MSKFNKFAAPLGAVSLVICGNALSAEGFQVRYSLVGSLGGEMFANKDISGPVAGIVLTTAKIRKVTGGDGGEVTLPLPGGTVPIPGAPAALYPSYGPNMARLDITGETSQFNLNLGYITRESYSGGRFVFGMTLPYATRSQRIAGSAPTPNLSSSPAIPAAAQAAVNAQFRTQYQSGLAAQAAAETGEVDGLGDAELVAAWRSATNNYKLAIGAAVIIPTGKYSSTPGPDIGGGDYLTLRPEIAFAYFPQADVGIATKVMMGFNTRNRDNQLRSGNWAGVESAVGYRSPYGVFGAHAIYLNQYRDDENNDFGAARLRSTNAGVFYTTLIPVVNAAVTLQYSRTVSSRYSKHGDLAQIRVTKVF